MNENRRQIIKNSVIGGGLGKIWMAPSVFSIAIPAHAKSSIIKGPTCSDTLTDNDAFTETELPVSNQVLSVRQYDGDASTLQQVVVTIRGRVFGSGQFENRQASETDYTLNVNSLFDYTLPFSSTPSHSFELTDSQEMTLPAYDGELNFEGESSANFEVDTSEKVQTFTLTDPADIEAFIGTGTVDFTANVAGEFTALGSSQQANATFLFAEGSVEVEYLCSVS